MKSKQILLLVGLMLISIIMMACTIVYMVINTENLEASVKRQLTSINIPSIDELTPDQAQIILGVAQYCQANNGCRGEKGDSIQGPKGDTIQGPVGDTGKPGESITGQRGPSPTADDIAAAVSAYCSIEERCRGAQGIQGSDGRKYVERCNSDKRQVEWQYEGDEFWNFKYKLSPLQSCEGGI